MITLPVRRSSPPAAAAETSSWLENSRGILPDNLRAECHHRTPPKKLNVGSECIRFMLRELLLQRNQALNRTF